MRKREEKGEVGGWRLGCWGIDAPVHSISIIIGDVGKVVYFVSCRPRCV